MTRKKLWCAFLIVVLTVTAAVPARAVNPAEVLIIVVATTLAAAIAVGVAVASVHHKRKKIVITGCVMSGNKGMTLTDEEDDNPYFLVDWRNGSRSACSLAVAAATVSLKAETMKTKACGSVGPNVTEKRAKCRQASGQSVS